MKSIAELNQELDQLLKSNPELLSLQAKISFQLAMMDSAEARAAYVFEEMMDSFDLLSYKLNEAVIELHKVKNAIQLEQ